MDCCVVGDLWLRGAVTKQKSTDCGDRTHDHEIKSLALYRTELSRLLEN